MNEIERNGHLIDKACVRYEHTITIVLTTQFPENGIAEITRQMMGPWCKSSVLVRSVDTQSEELT